jgi:MarR family transcriptional regulator, 2-MHQ and catechol-resistance regulon repressor
MAGYAGTAQERLALRTFVKLVRAANGLNARLNRPLSQSGLTESQFGVLEALLHLGPLHQRELAGKILHTHGNVTLVVDQLERRGLVRRERGSADRRFVRVHLTDEGAALVRGLFPAHAARLAAEMSLLSEDEQRELGRLCRRLMGTPADLAAAPAGDGKAPPDAVRR